MALETELPEIVVTPEDDGTAAVAQQPVDHGTVAPSGGMGSRGAAGNEAMGTCVVEVDGTRYDNFLSLSLKRSKEETTCSGTITMSWPGAEVSGGKGMPAKKIVDGAKGKIYLDGQLAATIIFDTRTSQGSANEYTCAFAFRGKSSPVVDGGPKHETGQENQKTPIQICKKLMEGYEVQMQDKSGMARQLYRFIVGDGESVDRAMRRATRAFGLNYWEQPDGNLLLEKKSESSGGGQHFVLGKNFFEWTTQRDMSPRNSETELKTNAVPRDEEDKYGKNAEVISGKTKDKGVPFVKYRAVHEESDHDKDTTDDRSEFESDRRSSQGLNVTLHLSTWSDDGGQLWKVGAKHQVSIPVDEVDQQLTVVSVTFELTPTTRSTQMSLTSEDKGDSGGDATKQGDVMQNKSEPAPDPKPPPTP